MEFAHCYRVWSFSSNRNTSSRHQNLDPPNSAPDFGPEISFSLDDYDNY
jgi:hypothetical protein